MAFGQHSLTVVVKRIDSNCVSTVGLGEQTIRQYLREQEELQRRKGETVQQQFNFG